MKKTLATLLVVALVASLCGVMFVSAEATNLVAGKTYTISEQFHQNPTNWGYDENYPAAYPDENYELTDGKLPEASFGDAAFMGFNQQTPPQAERGYAFVKFDLGAVCDLDELSYYTHKDLGSGIQAPTSVEVYVSNDGENYELAGSKTYEGDEHANMEDKVNHEVAIALDASARYVEVRFVSKGWCFLGEIEIFGTAAASEPEAPATKTAVTAKVLDGKLAYDEAKLANLADGNDAAGATAFSDAGFVSFENKGFTHTDGVGAAVPATIELVRDLGSVQAISKITLNAFKDSNSMIALPTVNFYVSVDGVNYYQINAGAAVAPKDDLAETATAAITADFSTRIAVNARYVKAVATFQNGWIFLSELSVTAAAEGNYVDNLDAGYAYTEHSVPNPGIGIFDSTDGDLDLSTNDGSAGLLFKNSQIIKAKYNADKGAYEIIYSKVNPWPDGHSGTETMAEDEILVAISTGGNIAADANFSGAKWLARGLKEGDYIVLNEGIITFYPADGKLPGGAEDKPATGDAGVLVFVVLAVVAVAGVAVVSKAKKAL